MKKMIPVTEDKSLLLQLPEVILMQIFGNLEPLKIKSISVVCKRFYTVANSEQVWKNQIAKESIVDERFSNLIEDDKNSESSAKAAFFKARKDRINEMNRHSQGFQNYKKRQTP